MAAKAFHAAEEGLRYYELALDDCYRVQLQALLDSTLKENILHILPFIIQAILRALPDKVFLQAEAQVSVQRHQHGREHG